MKERRRTTKAGHDIGRRKDERCEGRRRPRRRREVQMKRRDSNRRDRRKSSMNKGTKQEKVGKGWLECDTSRETEGRNQGGNFVEEGADEAEGMEPTYERKRRKEIHR